MSERVVETKRTGAYHRLAAVSVWLAGIAVACVTVLAFGLMYQARPVADDLCRATAPNSDWARIAWRTYFEWSGRWGSFALEQALTPWILDPLAYSVSLAVLELVFLGGLYVLARTLLDSRTSSRHVLACVTAFWALGWSTMPAPDQTVYWFTGYVEYRLSLALAILLFCSCLRLARAHRGAAVVGLAAIAPLSLFVAGMHELVAFLLVGAFAMLALRRHDALPMLRPVALVLLGMAIVGLVIVVAAPGNAIRAATTPRSYDLTRTVFHGAKFLLRDVLQWMVAPQLLALSLYLLLSPGLLSVRREWVKHDGGRWIRRIPAFAVAFLAVGAMVPAWGLGGSPNGRTQDLLHAVFLIAWFLTLILLTSGQPALIPHHDRRSSWIRHAALTAFAISLMMTGNAEVGFRDLDKRTEPWNAAMTARQVRLENAGPDTHVVFERPPPPPILMFTMYDLTSDPEQWQNQCFAACYGIASVRVETLFEHAQRFK